jgi:hypothetical protein
MNTQGLIEHRPAARATGRALAGVFHDYVRAVFAEHSLRRGAVQIMRERWLNGFAPRLGSSASQRWKAKAKAFGDDY